MYRPTLDEQETIIRYDRASDTATIYTADPAMIRRLAYLMEKTTQVCEKKRDEYGRWYECPKSLVNIRKPYNITEENSAKRAEAMRGCGS